ncbi:hypothetical protein N0V88_003503 [Collariella sp. IMI 366227]|nr:hypothetical protein N0V88_003503 [Collariella sp. IMI 366227]
MDSVQYKAESINGAMGRLRRALQGYVEEGSIHDDRKVQKPRPKGAQDFLLQCIDDLDLISKESNTFFDSVASLIQPSLPAESRPDTPLSYNHNNPVTHQVPASAGQPAQHAPFHQTSSAPLQQQAVAGQALFQEIRLKDGSIYRRPVPSTHASPLFDCTYHDIHVLNEELFEIYSAHPVVRDLGYFKIQVRDLPDINVQKVRPPGKDHATSFIYKVNKKSGLVKVDSGKKVKFTPPRLPFHTSSKADWSLQEQRDLWNSSAADPPKGDRAYIIGNPLFDDVELSPGEKLRRRGRARLEGINSQYVYFNLTGKTITTMHREDAHVRSENLLRSGEHKFWCFVKPAFARKLEEKLAVEYPEMRCCSQAVRHLSLNIPPAKLDEWGVEYTLDYCVPGQAVVTEPGTYHQVLNLGPNYAVAVNVEYKSSPDMPLGYRFCDGFCPDKFAISADDFRIYEKPRHLVEELPRTPETTASQEEHTRTPIAAAPPGSEPATTQITQSATPPPEHSTPQHPEPSRLPPSPSERQASEESLPGGPDLTKAIEDTLHTFPELHIFLSRFFKMRVAAWLEETVSKSGAIAFESYLDGMLRMLGWQGEQRHTLHDYVREGKCWNTVCGQYDGLLCLIPSDADCFDLGLYHDELARFHSGLDTEFVRRLCAIGAILQRTIWQNQEVPEFIWESMPTTWLSVEQISPLLAPFRLLRSNHYEVNSGYYWPRPAGWHWGWPADPSTIRPGDKPCDLCPYKSCRCADGKIPQVPRMLDNGWRGPGIRSVGPYQANDIIGELVGELVPPGASHGDWVLELCRPDLEDQVVAEIYPWRMGNWVRKVNHSTDPSAVFRVMKISGRWRQMLVARRNIADGEEITAKYGKGFLKGQAYSVVEGLL